MTSLLSLRDLCRENAIVAPSNNLAKIVAISLLFLDQRKKERSPRCARDDTPLVIANPRHQISKLFNLRKGGVAISLLFLDQRKKERSPRYARDDMPFVIANPRHQISKRFNLRKGGVAISLLFFDQRKKERSPRYARDDMPLVIARPLPGKILLCHQAIIWQRSWQSRM